MITINYLYDGIDGLRRVLEKQNFQYTAPCLVKLFTSCMNRGEAVDTAKQIKERLPNARIVGATAAGIIFEGRQYEDRTMVLVEQYDSLQVDTCCFSWEDKTPWELAREVRAAFRTPNHELVHIIFSDRYYDVNAFVEEINRISPVLRLTGGIAGDLLVTDEPGFVFTEQGAVRNGAVAFSVTGSRAVCFIDVNTAQEPISSVFTVTGTKGSLIETIDNEPAARWLYRYLDLDEFRAYDGWKSIAEQEMGEIGFISGQNEFYNGSCVVTGIAENKQFITPDFTVFAGLGQMNDDVDRVGFALAKKRETLSAERYDVLEGIEHRFLAGQKHMYSDARFGLPNVLMYQQDKRIYGMDKMCMVQVENDDILITYAGLEAYLENTKKIIEQVRRLIFEYGCQDKIVLYCVTQSVFFFTGKATVDTLYFEQVMRRLYKKFQYYKPDEKSLAQMARFVLVYDQEDDLQGGLSALQATKDIQSHFIIYRAKNEAVASSAKELEMIELLNAAISKDGIHPFYQGIRNNSTGYIDRYEALMRLIAPGGSVYYPDAFLDIAKKYHLYMILSQTMIEKVLEEFRGREEMVAINLSVYDVNSPEFRKWFFDRLMEFPDRQRIAVEFVESEDYTSSGDISIFVEQLHAIGCRVAIDDFGSGYSSMMGVIAVKPDYIKVDGSIIRHLNDGFQNLVLLRTIIFLAKQLGIQTVAEYVEDETIQEILEKNGVDFSQGFLFSKPEPF